MFRRRSASHDFEYLIDCQVYARVAENRYICVNTVSNLLWWSVTTKKPTLFPLSGNGVPNNKTQTALT